MLKMKSVLLSISLYALALSALAVCDKSETQEVNKDED